MLTNAQGGRETVLEAVRTSQAPTVACAVEVTRPTCMDEDARMWTNVFEVLVELDKVAQIIGADTSVVARGACYNY